MEASEASRPGGREGSLNRSHKSKGTVGGREGGRQTSGNLEGCGRGYGGWEPGTLTLSVLPQEAISPFPRRNKNMVSYI